MKIAVIGAGFSGLAVSALLAKNNQVSLFEKNPFVGGRAWSKTAHGFSFDMGPSWYMMPEVHEKFFLNFNKKPSDYYNLKKLEPAYKVFDKNETLTINGDLKVDMANFEKIEPGAGKKLKELLENSKLVYELSMDKILYTDQLSLLEIISPNLLKYFVKGKYYKSYQSIINDHFRHPTLRKAMSFMAVFLGGDPKELPGIYSLMTYADMGQNIWYPLGGFKSVISAYEQVAKKQGAEFKLSEVVESVKKRDSSYRLKTNKQEYDFDIVVCSGEYSYFDQHIAAPDLRQYSSKYWKSRTVSPSAQMIYLGIKGKLNLPHHSLFLDSDWNKHFQGIKDQETITDPLFYVSCPSQSDNSVAPKNHHNVFILIPQAAYVKQTSEEQDIIIKNVFERISKFTGNNIAAKIVYQEIKDINYFKDTFFAQGGNAFGLAHTLKQSSIFRPPIKHKSKPGLYFTGQFTNPGTGVPLAVISAQVVADRIKKDYA